VTVDQLLAQTMLEDKQEQEDREISKNIFKERAVKRLIEDNDEVETKESRSLYQNTANTSSQQVNSSSISNGNGSLTVPFKGMKFQIKAKKVMKEDEPPKNALASSVKKGLLNQSETPSITTGGASPSSITQAQASNKLACLLNYSDDE